MRSSKRRHKAQTPFVPDAWELMLTQLSLFHFLPTLPNILRHGADAGIHPISQVHAPRNSKSLEQNSDVFLALVLHEF